MSEKKPEDEKRLNLSETVGGTLDNKIRILLEAIEEIETEIERRRILSGTINDRINSNSLEVQRKLNRIENWQLGNNQSIEMRRLGLERELLSLRKQKRAEIVKAWQDTEQLIKRRRDLIMEYQSLLKTKEALRKAGGNE